MADGTIVVACNARTPDSANLSKTAAVCYWKVNSSDATSDWAFLSRFSLEPQTDRNHGEAWMAMGPWDTWTHTSASDRGPGKLTDFLIAYTDYRAQQSVSGVKESATGGILGLVRATRSGTTSAWDDPPIASDYVYHDEYTDGRKNMHFHTGSVLFPDSENPDAMVVTLSVGDTQDNNRIVTIERDDYTTFDDMTGPGSNPAPDAAFIPDIPTPTSGTTNGWRVNEDREGQRRRLFFSGAKYTAGSPPTLSFDSPLSNLRVPSGSDWATNPMPVGVTNDKSTLSVSGVQAVSTDKKTQTLTCALNDTEDFSISGKTYSGWFVPDNSAQFMLQMPTGVRNEFIAGTDEAANALARVTVSNGLDRLVARSLYGVSTDMAVVPWAGENRVFQWNVFLGSVRSPMEGKDYAALMQPGSVGANPNDESQTLWSKRNDVGWIIFSPDGELWSQMWKPNDVNWIPSGFYGSNGYFIGCGGAGPGLIKIPIPATRTRRPLAVSTGGDNYLRRASTSPYDSIEWANSISPGSKNRFTRVDPSTSFGSGGSLSTEFGYTIPPPPSMGPIVRAAMVDVGYFGVLKIADGVPDGQFLRLRLWIHPLTPKNTSSDKGNTADTVNHMPSNSTAGSLRVQLGFSDGSGGYYDNGRSKPVDVPAAFGHGWHPVTLSTDTNTWTDSDGVLHPPNNVFDLLLELTGQGGGFQRQEMLIAFEYVLYGPSVDGIELPGQPMFWNASATPPYTSNNERLKLSGVPAQQNRPFSFFTAFRLPDSGPDVFTNLRTSKKTVFTLYQNTTKFIKVQLLSDPDGGNNKIVLIDGNSNMLVISGPGAEMGLPAQPFYFLRGTQVLLGISRVIVDSFYDKYRIWASVGGTRVLYAQTSTGYLQSLRPTQILFGEPPNGDNTEAVEHFGVWVNDDTATEKEDGEAMLQTLSFLD